MEHFSTTTKDGKTVAVSNVVMIKNETTDEKENVVMIVNPEEGEDNLTGEILFEAVFDDNDDSDAFYELLAKANLVTVG